MSTGLRRRRYDQRSEPQSDPLFQNDDISNNNVNEDNNNNEISTQSRQRKIGVGIFQLSRVYILLSVVSALLVIVMPPIEIEYHWLATNSRSSSKNSNPHTNTGKRQQGQRRKHFLAFFGKLINNKEHSCIGENESPGMMITDSDNNSLRLSWFEQQMFRFNVIISSEQMRRENEHANKRHMIESAVLDQNTHHSILELITSITDKGLKSTIRLCVLTNFTNVIFYLLHSTVAGWILLCSGSPNGVEQQQEQPPVAESRERMAGFVVFKLLLISAIIEPDTFDLLVLVTWFTQLGLMKTLDHISHSINIHTTAIGQPPKTRVVKLLLWVLICDILSTYCCYKMFHSAGWEIVLLLSCDCALLGVETTCHILKYYQCVLEHAYDSSIFDLEEEEEEEDNSSVDISREEETQVESQRLFQRFETLESILESTIFYLEIMCKIVTVAHFIHIWNIHGLQFTLIDGVLALHLHSAISSACTKLTRRRHIHNISRDLHGIFSDATNEELRNASISGDVCCICLGTMAQGGNVKKIACGHLFHAHCLRDVIEREQNLETTKCPLCRTPLIDTSRSANTGPGIDNIVPVHRAGGEQALFRFSTEGILPIWVLPAFSFEVVRRRAIGAEVAAARVELDETDAIPVDPVTLAPSNQQESNLETNNDQVEEQLEPQLSFIRRLMMLTRPIPMSPEEEARALNQLIDMFPRRTRNNLRTELRHRGSIEAVTEAILMDDFVRT